MRPRTLLLLAVLGLTFVAYAAHTTYRERERERERDAATTAAAFDESPAYRSAELEHPRIEDAAGILAPFGPRLGRMADAFNDDLGIDVHIVTSTDDAASIESQSYRMYEERGVGAGARIGGVLVIMNPRIERARIEVGYPPIRYRVARLRFQYAPAHR